MSEPEKIFAKYHERFANASRLHTAPRHASSDLPEAGKESDGFGNKVEKALRRAKESVGKASGGRSPGAQWLDRKQTVFQHVHKAVNQHRAALDRGNFPPNTGVFKTSDLHSAAMEHLRSQFTGLGAAVMHWHMPAVDRITSHNGGTASPQVDRGAEAIKSLSAAITGITAEMKWLRERMAKGVASVLG